jgi:hypothetical protein
MDVDGRWLVSDFLLRVVKLVIKLLIKVKGFWIFEILGIKHEFI